MMPDFGFDLAGRKDPRLARGLACGILAALVETLPYLVLYHALGRVMAGSASASLALQVLLALAACNGVLVWLKARANVLNFGAVYTLAADARLRVADGLGRLPLGRLQQRRRAAIVELLTGRYTHYQEIVARVWGLSVANAAVPLFLWLLLCALQPALALLCAVLGPAAYLVIPWSHRLLSRADTRLAALREQTVAALLEQAECQRDLRQFDRRGARLARALDLLDRLRCEQMRAELAPAPALLLFGCMLQAGFAAVALAAALGLGVRLAPVDFLVFLVVSLRYFRALGDLGLNLAELRHARDTLAHIRDLAAEPPLPQPAAPRIPVGNTLTLEGVGLCHHGAARPALDGIDGVVTEGQRVALVGASGSGKSTLASLLARMWDPDRGAIRIGGVDLRDMAARTLNQRVALMLQEVALFRASVADNLRLGRPDASLDEVMAAARAAHAHGFIERLPQGYETVLDESVIRLSGGERQRLAIARALLKDAPILVLDEALASVDPENAWEIQRALDELARGRTVLAIAHQLRSVVDADAIWVMRDGRIIERGRHAALLAANGEYARLWRAQAPD